MDIFDPRNAAHLDVPEQAEAAAIRAFGAGIGYSERERLRMAVAAAMPHLPASAVASEPEGGHRLRFEWDALSEYPAVKLVCPPGNVGCTPPVCEHGRKECADCGPETEPCWAATWEDCGSHVIHGVVEVPVKVEAEDNESGPTFTIAGPARAGVADDSVERAIAAGRTALSKPVRMHMLHPSGELEPVDVDEAIGYVVRAALAAASAPVPVDDGLSAEHRSLRHELARLLGPCPPHPERTWNDQMIVKVGELLAKAEAVPVDEAGGLREAVAEIAREATERAEHLVERRDTLPYGDERRMRFESQASELRVTADKLHAALAAPVQVKDGEA